MPNETPAGNSDKPESDNEAKHLIPEGYFLEDDPRSSESMAARGGEPPSVEEVAQYLLANPQTDPALKRYDLPTLTADITSGKFPVVIDPREPMKPDPEPEIQPDLDEDLWGWWSR